MVPEHKNTTSRRKFKHLSAFEIVSSYCRIEDPISSL